jgi:hypothetical protein
MANYMSLITQQLGISVSLMIIIFIWSFVWKLLALWKSARKGSVVWFIVLALINTLGLLEILYIFVFSKMKCKGSKSVKKRAKKRRK